MEFCVISPTAGLERYAVLSKTHLVLAHECGTVAGGPTGYDYRNFYQTRRQAGDFLILDNGAYENHSRFDEDMIHWLEPQVLVLPDYLLQPWRKTWHAAIHFLDEWYDVFSPKTKFLYIPQAVPGDLQGFIESYHEAVQDPRITWLGIPRALAYAITDNPLARVEFARMVRRDHPGIKLHAFGMVNGDVHELPYLAQVGVTSIDSSAPVWRGWHGYTIDQKRHRDYWDEKGTSVCFEQEPFSAFPHFDEVIKHNLEACGVNTSTPTR